jgi:uncharacterized coiled-coil protein SlyX
MRIVSARVSAALLFLLVATVLHAQQTASPEAANSVPRVVPVTGVFVPTNGQPAAPVEIVTVAIYAEETGGTPLWQETQSVRVDERGRYSLLLGATQAGGIPPAVLASGAQWMSTVFERAGEVEGARVRMTSVPYALRASDADTLGGRPASDYVVAGGGKARAAGSTSEEQSSVVGPNTVLPGATNFISKYVNATDIGTSAVYETGGLVGVGTTSPQDALHVRFTNTAGGMTGLAVQNLGSTATSYSGMLFFDQNGALGQFQGFNNSTHEYRINNVASSGSINFMIASSSKFKVANNGYIGINNSAPALPLDIVGSANGTNVPAITYFQQGNTSDFTQYAGGPADLLSIRATGGVLAYWFAATSDERMKHIKGQSDGAADLRKLLGIKITDFLFKDAVEKGTRPQKKVIAQQVEKVFPEAVSKTTDVVPDIYRKASINNGWVELATDLKVGDRVRLITERGHRAVHEVLEVKGDKFRTDFAEDAGEVFVYGREVKDFRVVDYEAIAMLNVSATQELNRLITQQDGEIQALTARLAALEQILKDLAEKQLPK